MEGQMAAVGVVVIDREEAQDASPAGREDGGGHLNSSMIFVPSLAHTS